MTYLTLAGLFVGHLFVPEGVAGAITGGLWYGLLLTLGVGLPGAVAPRVLGNARRGARTGD